MYVFHSTAPAEPMMKKIINHPGKNCILDAHKIICENQIIAAIHRANRAFESNTMLAKIWAVELLLQLAGTHQINEAINLLGVTKETTMCLIIAEDKLEMDDLIPGFPSFPSKSASYYGLTGPDYCKEVIAKGVLMMMNKE